MNREEILKKKNYVIYGITYGSVIVSMLKGMGAKQIVLCNNSGDCENGVLLDDALREIVKHNLDCNIYIGVSRANEYQILKQIHEYKEIREDSIVFFSELVTVYDSFIRERGDIIDYRIDYEKHVNKWAVELMSEVKFWKEEVLTSGGRCYQQNVERNSVQGFSCGRIPERDYRNKTILDLGCGLIYQWGCGNSEDVNYVPVDPLAYYYNNLYSRWEKANGFRKPTHFGMIEFLSNMYHGDADYILIDNAIDHCIDPLKGLLEALKVLKKDGTLSLFTYENESLNALGWGLHQWNLALNNEKEFIIWNFGNYVNVSKYLKDYIDFSLVEDETWYKKSVGCHRTFAVNMVKRKEIPREFYPDDRKEMTQAIDAIMKSVSRAEYGLELNQIY
ncbi:MAG: class I SAM-dependent methyltransferase [Lachnospiraceae bacterium]|nr:class I SAM-dependent methyltransferase [Lachnospiraceae bacterium]